MCNKGCVTRDVPNRGWDCIVPLKVGLAHCPFLACPSDFNSGEDFAPFDQRRINLMSKQNHRIANLGKRVRHTFVFASAAILMLTCSANAGTVLQFTQAFPTDIITATDVAGVTTL